MQPRNCEIIVKEIDKYQLLDKDEQIFKKIKEMINNFDFDEAIEILRGKQ